MANVTIVALVSDLASADPAISPAVTVTGDGDKNGLFIWQVADQTANVSRDPTMAIWVPPLGASTGRNGAWKRDFDGPVNLKWFGAVGKGNTDDTVAIQAWINFLSYTDIDTSDYRDYRLGYAPSGAFAMSGMVTAPVASYWGWTGDGPYQSLFFYSHNGILPTDFVLFDFGSSAPMKESRGCNFSGFSIFANTPMPATSTLWKLSRFTRANFSNLAIGGELHEQNLSGNGIWLNGCHELSFNIFDFSNNAGDGLRVNGLGTTVLDTDANSDLYLQTGCINRCGTVGLRCAGNFGGLYIGEVQMLGSAVAQIYIDNSENAITNREIIIGSDFVADGVQKSSEYNIVLDADSSDNANITCHGFMGSAIQHSIYIKDWKSGYVNLAGGRIFNNLGDGVHIEPHSSDKLPTLICGSGLTIDHNTGWGIFGQALTENSNLDAVFFDNGSGDIAPRLGKWNTGFVPAITYGSTPFPGASATFEYSSRGKTVRFRALVHITANGGASGDVTLTLPLSAAEPSIVSGRATVSGKALQGFVSGNTLAIVSYDNSYPGATGEYLLVGGVYEAI